MHMMLPIIGMMLHFLGKLFGVIIFLSLSTKFDRKKTTKSLLITSFISLLIVSFIEVMGGLNGVKLTLEIFISSYMVSFFINLLAFAIIVPRLIKKQWYLQKWFSRNVFILACILYSLILFVVLPQVLIEQINM